MSHLIFQHAAHVDKLDARLYEALGVTPDLPVHLGGLASLVVHRRVLQTLLRSLLLARDLPKSRQYKRERINGASKHKTSVATTETWFFNAPSQQTKA